MADRRGVRSSSRRITPTPHPPPAVEGRTTRRKGTRSASADVESAIPAKPTRRAARQASLQLASEGDREAQSGGRPRRKAPKQAAMADLAPVEEIDTQIDADDQPSTPRRSPEGPLPHRSPGAVSEMSGTTAISSFSMVEAEALEARYILRHLPKLYDATREFLEHLAPPNNRMKDDHHNILEMQKPDSVFNKDFRDYDEELNLQLRHFRSEHHQYIRPRAVRRALLGPDRDPNSKLPGIDLILYLANLLIFAKQMMGSDRDEKDIYDALRELDYLFPALFTPAVVAGKTKNPDPGASRLLEETWNLALELRIQMFVLVIQRGPDRSQQDPDSVLTDVFFSKNSSEGEDSVVLQGWDIPGLQSSELPQDCRDRIVEQMNDIRSTFLMDSHSLDRGDTVDVELLGSRFPWSALVIQLLDWVRKRSKELQSAIEDGGGARAITENLREVLQNPDALQAQPRSKRESPRKSRRSFGSDRRSSRRYNQNELIDDRVLDRVRMGAVIVPPVQQQDELNDIPVLPEQEEFHPALEEPVPVEPEAAPEEPEAREEPEPEPEPEAEPPRSGPPQSTADLVKLTKEMRKADKENRGRIFERQPNAARIEFGTGFDSQPGPSTDNGKQPQQSSPKKRPRVEDDDSDEDFFETEARDARVEERRSKAPVRKKKKVRIDPGSSAPPSHQPRAQVVAPDESLSEPDAPDMTEEAPPASTYREVRQLAERGIRHTSVQRPRKARTAWSAVEEEAMLEYMAMFPRRYAEILKHDDSEEGYSLLQDRTQVNLKDKARNMAINMIKSGVGLKPGFEDVIPPSSREGEKLAESGYVW
ncbi:hypothetical protein P154DRAFT_523204 [Amniculicola lignicola CBS 123094]|uniref:Myb-like domain-containing protein n=1 Tax=Amniculicola lignicola CBS 123094 TaxID=1392246 RepID=A0A6A5WDZ4_9PLEO|nr:hypothetical protein P154DRAFT_523204 [Amniculicola lignicola CBS 123094]